MPSRMLLSCALLALSTAAAGQAAQNQPRPPSVTELIDCMLERVEATNARLASEPHTFLMERVTHKLHGDGRIKDSEQQLFRAQPVKDSPQPFLELIEEDGAPLDAKEQREQDKRRREFLEELHERREDPDAAQDKRVAFDRFLVDRYTGQLEGFDIVGGRGAWLVSFLPREGELPDEHRYDRVLNRLRGRIWVDTESWEIARIEIELMEKVKVWKGLVANVSLFEGKLQRAPLEPGFWFPRQVDVVLDGRVLFRSLNQRLQFRWREFEWMDSMPVLVPGPELSSDAGTPSPQG